MQTQLRPLVTRPCTRCGRDLKDPASIQAGIGPHCRGYANAILAKEVPSAWSDQDLSAFYFLNAESFPAEARERFEKAFTAICASKGMNQAEAAKGDDMRAIVQELVYLASVAPTNAIFEALMGAIRGVGYVQYAAFVSGESASGEATLSYEGGKVFLQGVRNAVGQEALKKIGATWEKNTQRWTTSAERASDFVRVACIYWPFAKGAQEVLAATKRFFSLEEHPAGQVVLLRFSENEALVEEFLAKVPWYHRQLDTQEGCWRVRSSYKTTLESLLARFF